MNSQQGLSSEPPKRGRKTGAARKLSKSVEKYFDTFWRFLTFFALREKCRKVSRIFLTLFDDFWRFLTWPLSAAPFCGPLISRNKISSFSEMNSRKHFLDPQKKMVPTVIKLETNLASHWEGVRLPQKFPELPRKFSATSPEVLSLWNWIAIQRFPGSFPDFPGSSPDFPGSSPDFPGSSPDFPGGQPFLWEAGHPLLTHKNFLWFNSQLPRNWKLYNSCEHFEK